MNLSLLLTTIILSILLGFVAVAISFGLQKRFELSFIKSYFYHQILIFLFGFYGLLGTIIAHYFLVDVEIKTQVFRYLPSFLPFIGVPFMIAAWHLFIRISFEIIEKKISLRFTLLFFVTLILIFLLFGFLVPYIDFFNVDQSQINTHVFLFFILIEIFTLTIVYYNYFVRSVNERLSISARFIKLFATINIAIYIISVSLLVLSEQKNEFISIYIILYFSKDIIPLLLVRKYLLKNYVHPANAVKEENRETFIEKYGISKRESEIIDEIIKGKSNKEIGETLFISLQTVKDHIHNIYLKTEVKNRVQLSNLIHEYKLK